MATIDVHQHLLPAGFVHLLRSRRTPPRIDGAMLHVAEGEFAYQASDEDLEGRLALLDEHGIDEAVLSLQPTLGYDDLRGAERAELVRAWEEEIDEVVAASGGRLSALSCGPMRPGFAGACVGSESLLDLDALEPVVDSVLHHGGFLFVHPSGGAVRAGAPHWWAALTLYTAQMQAAYLAWLAGGAERWPDLRVAFAILAGGGPIQLERLASRGVDVRSNLSPNLFFDTASYGRRALELCIETFGVEQLVHGSDAPVIDPGPGMQVLRSFGDSVETLLRSDNPDRLRT